MFVKLPNEQTHLKSQKIGRRIIYIYIKGDEFIKK
jgi:hypothetical protein